LHRRAFDAKPSGAQADLIDRFLAGDVGGGAAARRDRRGRLQQQRRLADARIAEPGTRPPPQTRSSSAMPVRWRGAARLSPRSATKSSALSPRPLPVRLFAKLFGGPERGNSSTRLFHAPQASQRPAHLG
jgi:hypothetical protein